MADIDLSQFHEVFFEEAFEGLNTMESGLLELNPEKPNSETINNIFRAAHSIKGGAGTFGFNHVSTFTHGVETLMDEVRSGDKPVTDELIQLLLESVDYMKQMLQDAQAGREISEQQLQTYLAALTAYQEGGEQPTATSVAVESEVHAAWKIEFKPEEGLFQSGNDPYRILRELSELGDVEPRLDASKLPSLADIEPENCYLSWELSLHESEASESSIVEVFEWVENEAEIHITPREEEVVYELAPEPEEPSQPEAPAVDIEKPEVISATTPEVTSIRVNIDRVDMLVNLVGELVITQSMLSRFREKEGDVDIDEMIRGIEQLEENTRELQEQTMRIRMLPVDNVFQRMPRLVRDLSKSLGKEVELIINGRSTEVDKTVLEKISDPLTHLVRNCLDHGVETPEARKAAGKPGAGTVEISAYHEGGSIIIQVKDDGRGLNREAILKKALANGIIDADAELSDTQIDQLIFSPGFSTAESVSDVSGRGVGMDVVKNNIEQLNGHIDVHSEDGKGSRFTIKLPLTLAIIEGQLVRVGTDIFIVPILSIVKSTKIKPEDYNVVAGESSLFKLEDSYIPVVSLKDTYRINSDYKHVTDGILVIIDAVNRFGILVDEVLGQQQVVVKSLETNFKEVPTISGATILGDGTVAMILDMPGLLRETQKRETAAA